MWQGNEVVREPGDLAPHKVPRSTQLKFQHDGIELGLHGKKSSREKKSTLYGALSKLDNICGVLGGCQKSGAPHKMWKFYTSTTTIEINFE